MDSISQICSLGNVWQLAHFEFAFCLIKVVLLSCLSCSFLFIFSFLSQFSRQPDNILVTEFLRAKISDFGTSCAQDVDSDDIALGAAGTPLFCAPEILRGEAYDASADVYSFGLLLLAMV